MTRGEIPDDLPFALPSIFHPFDARRARRDDRSRVTSPLKTIVGSQAGPNEGAI